MAMDPTALFNQKKIGEALRQKRETSPIMYIVRGAHIKCSYSDEKKQIDMPLTLNTVFKDSGRVMTPAKFTLEYANEPSMLPVKYLKS